MHLCYNVMHYYGPNSFSQHILFDIQCIYACFTDAFTVHKFGESRGGHALHVTFVLSAGRIRNLNRVEHRFLCMIWCALLYLYNMFIGARFYLASS